MPSIKSKHGTLTLPCGTGKSLDVSAEAIMKLWEQCKPQGLSLGGMYVYPTVPEVPTAAELALLPPQVRERRRQIIERVVDCMLEILSSSDRWTKGSVARGPGGDPLNPTSGAAEQWCLLGALERSLDLMMGIGNVGIIKIPLYTDYRLVDVRGVPSFERLTFDQYEFAATLETRRFLEAASWEDHGRGIAEWNDLVETTFEDVHLWVKRLFDRIDPAQGGVDAGP